MFRKPRDTTTAADVGRSPSPGASPAKTPFSLARPPSVPLPTRSTAMAKTRISSKATPLPTIGRQGFVGSGKKPVSTAKLKEKNNSTILSFFKKEETGLFFSSATTTSGHDLEDARFNENESPQKRRRLSTEEGDFQPAVVRKPSATAGQGPFMEDSDDEDDESTEHVQESPSRCSTDIPVLVAGIVDSAPVIKQEPVVSHQASVLLSMPDSAQQDEEALAYRPPLLKHETSFAPELDEFRDFDGLEGDFEEDIYEEGDEYIERRYMEEQERLENAEASGQVDTAQAMTASCPICNASLSGMGEQEAAVHVNHCLDGNPSPVKQESTPAKSEGSVNPKQFKWPPRAPRPGQANPFTLGESAETGGTAFNKIMSGKLEDAAWAEAAASEHASRGKPSWQRTCPFYKILPGFNICVDAFRYGAVQGAAAYFLSHFHSDHYVGLTSSWSHGPIYCSHVTANLVRQQLKVDPKFVIDLEFEQKVEVPGTKGVSVTMISANHCPGSSLYLFEKTVGTRTNGKPRVQRVLHCGDFRACKMHVEHPLLMPNVRDSITGKTDEQKLDVCYLDTTYLNPKYAFPSQERVIRACADMCMSLSKVSVDETDGWEQMKRQRAGEGMVKFVRRESSNLSIKEEPTDNDMKIEAAPNASQQILSSTESTANRGRLLVVCGTYSIGKERICLGIAKALNSKIYAPPSKQRIVAALEDPELNERMTSDPRAAQVHMLMLFELRAETLDDYLKDYWPHFTRVVGFRPSGWTYKPPNSRFTDSPSVQTVLYSDNWKSTFSMRDLMPQRGSTSRASCFGVPYSEHSSFRELTMFCCSLRIEKIIPTVNVGSATSRARMKAWIERWQNEKKKNGLFQLPEGESW